MTRIKLIGAALALTVSTGAFAAVPNSCADLACCKDGADCCDNAPQGHAMPAMKRTSPGCRVDGTGTIGGDVVVQRLGVKADVGGSGSIRSAITGTWGCRSRVDRSGNARRICTPSKIPAGICVRAT